METTGIKPTSSKAVKKGMPWQLILIFILLLVHIALNIVFLLLLKIPGISVSGFEQSIFYGYYVISTIFDILCIILLFLRREKSISIAKAYIVIAVTISFALTILLIWKMNHIYAVKVTENTGNELVFTVFMGMGEGGSAITEEGKMDLKKFKQMKSKKEDDNFTVYLDITKDTKGREVHLYSPMDYSSYRIITLLNGLAIILLVIAVVFLNADSVYNHIFAKELIKAPEV